MNNAASSAMKRRVEELVCAAILLEILKLPNVIIDFKGRWIGLQIEPRNNDIYFYFTVQN
jgi:hypothetical protein